MKSSVISFIFFMLGPIWKHTPTFKDGRKIRFKVHIFWEGHKNIKISQILFDFNWYFQFLFGNFVIFLWPSQNFIDFGPIVNLKSHVFPSVLGLQKTSLRPSAAQNRELRDQAGCFGHGKGHLISKRLFGVIILTKKPTKIF